MSAPASSNATINQQPPRDTRAEPELGPRRGSNESCSSTYVSRRKQSNTAYRCGGASSRSRWASVRALKRLVGHGPKNRFYRATRDLGRVFKTEFILDYLSQSALRTRIRRGLLKGEQLHALARCVHYGRLGRLDQRDFERQTGAASCLLLILAAIIYWQIWEIDRVLSEAGSDADDLNFELLSHISPIGWDNVLLYGEYQLNRSLVRSERLSV